MEVLLDLKRDPIVVLALSYYSNNATQTMVMDTCIAMLITRHYEEVEKPQQPLTVEELLVDVNTYGDIFRHEFIERTTEPWLDLIKERLELLEKLGDIKVIDGQIFLLSKPKLLTYSATQSGTIKSPPFSYVAFFNDMGLYLIDTYMIVLMASNVICDGNYVVKEKRLVNELHETIQTLYAD